jgi:cobalt-zinc-cadmium efflux system membrane fusion protein
MNWQSNFRSTLAGLLLGGVGLLVASCSDTPPVSETPEHKEAANGQDSSEEEGHEEGLVELSSEKSAVAGIETTIASIEGLSAQLTTTGQVDFNQDRLAHVSPRIPGRVHEVKARLGQTVRQGEVLAILDSIELGRAKAQYLQAKAREQLARENFAREERLFADRISSQKEMLVARAAFIESEAELRSVEETLRLYGLLDEDIASVTYENPGRSLFSIRAPLAGKVIDKHVTIGELVTPEENLFNLANLDEVWVWIDVYERDLQQVHVDDEVEVRVAAYPELSFRGKVSYLSDRVDPDTRRARARIDVKNPDERLRPGMFAQVQLSDPHEGGGAAVKTPSLVIPESALQRDGDAAFVFVALGDQRYQRRVVQIGRRAGDLVEVLEGLEAGEAVASAGVFFLKSELSKDELGEGDDH